MPSSSNPVFNRSEAFSSRGGQYTPTPSAGELDQMYAAPSATPTDTRRMTYDDVVMKTGITFGAVVAGAVVGWMFLEQLAGLLLPLVLVGFALALVNSFKKEPSPPLILAYALVQGVVVGTISSLFENYGINGQPLEGIASQAIFGTLVVVGVTLWAYRSGRVRATPKFRRIVLIAGAAYLVFVLFNIAAMVFNFGPDSPFGFRGGLLGIGISAVAIVLAAAFLVLDFDFVERGVKNGIPERFAWTAAFGLVATIIWMYIEMLRLLAILRSE